MDDLVAFLRARLDEREKKAQDAIQETTGRWTARAVDWDPRRQIVEDDCGAMILPTVQAYNVQYPHIADNDPEFVLADLAAKRQIIEQYSREPDTDGGFVDGWHASAERAIRLLALPFAGHPEFREEWRP